MNTYNQKVIDDIKAYFSNHPTWSPSYKSNILQHFEYYENNTSDPDFMFHILLFARLHGFPKIYVLDFVGGASPPLPPKNGARPPLPPKNGARTPKNGVFN